MERLITLQTLYLDGSTVYVIAKRIQIVILAQVADHRAKRRNNIPTTIFNRKFRR